MRVKETNLQQAILETIAYTDVFDFPLKIEEIHRYLITTPATLPEIHAILENDRPGPSRLESKNGYFTLPGRGHLIETRREREEFAVNLWKRARYYGQRIANLPFVRMVGVTGALAVNNPSEDDDLDYLVVTDSGRLWTCRALIIVLVVRLAALHGLVICPNYLLSENALEFKERNLYTAHELTQMVPLSGMATYRKLRQENRWTYSFLPNANGAPPGKGPLHSSFTTNRIRKLAESALLSVPGDWFERWEMSRKIHRFTSMVNGSEADFSPDWCKGHFDSHGQRTMNRYKSRLRTIERYE